MKAHIALLLVLLTAPAWAQPCPTVATLVQAATESLDGPCSLPSNYVVDCYGPNGEFPVECVCVGDLNGDHRTRLDEVLTLVDEALECDR